MPDLRTQLREYVESNIERHNADDIVATAVVSHRPVRPRRARRPMAVAAFSAVVVLVLIGGVLFLLRPTSEQEPAAPVPPPTPTVVPEQEAPVPMPEASLVPESESPLPAPEAPPVPAPSSAMSWSRLPADEGVFGGDGWQAMNDVVVGGPGFVAVGRDDSGGDRDGAVWYSTDGTDWVRVPHDEAVFGGPGDQQILAVTAAESGFVAVGSEGNGRRVLDEEGWPIDVERPWWDFDGAGTRAAVWMSEDGITWSRVAHDPDAFGSNGVEWMTAVTVGGPGFVAVGASYELIGEASDPLQAGNLDGDGAVWTSTDGAKWERVADPMEAFSGIGWQEMHGVTAGGPGLVAVGQEGFELLTPLGPNGRHVFDPDALTTAAVWTSPDGRTWTRVPQDKELFGHIRITSDVDVTVQRIAAGMSDVIAGGPGLVAVGQSTVCHPTIYCDDTAVVWKSVDGFEWTRTNTERAEPIRFFGGVSMEGIVQIGDRFVAVGDTPTSGPSVVWYSTDSGQSFTDQPHDCEVFGPRPWPQTTCGEAPNFMKAVVATDTGVVVAVGTHAFEAAVWIGTWNTAGD